MSFPGTAWPACGLFGPHPPAYGRVAVGGEPSASVTRTIRSTSGSVHSGQCWTLLPPGLLAGRALPQLACRPGATRFAARCQGSRRLHSGSCFTTDASVCQPSDPRGTVSAPAPRCRMSAWEARRRGRYPSGLRRPVRSATAQSASVSRAIHPERIVQVAESLPLVDAFDMAILRAIHEFEYDPAHSRERVTPVPVYLIYAGVVPLSNLGDGHWPTGGPNVAARLEAMTELGQVRRGEPRLVSFDYRGLTNGRFIHAEAVRGVDERTLGEHVQDQRTIEVPWVEIQVRFGMQCEFEREYDAAMKGQPDSAQPVVIERVLRKFPHLSCRFYDRKTEQKWLQLLGREGDVNENDWGACYSLLADGIRAVRKATVPVEPVETGGNDPAKPDATGYVASPSDLSSYVPMATIRADYCEHVALTSIKEITKVLEDFRTNGVRWTRPPSQTKGAPHPRRRSVHLVDWDRYVKRLKDRWPATAEEGFPDLSPPKIDARKAKIRRNRRAGK